MTDAALYTGRVMHRRLRPKVHQLKYRIFALLIDLDRIDAMDRRLRLFSRGRFNLVGFRDSDYGDGSGDPLRAQAERHLAHLGLTDVGAIRLLTMPRILGFAFNPLSLYFCHDRAGALTAILYEVHNTFGERHTYALAVGDDGAVRQSAAKRFHVSPFLPMALEYDFRVAPPGERLTVGITVSDRSGPLLVAVQSMDRRALTDAALLRAVALYPLMTVKVVAGILWEAGKLWLKGVAVHRHPGPRPGTVTYGKPAEAEPPRVRAA